MAETTRRRLERAEERTLAPYALRSKDATRRYALEEQGRLFDYRSQFQRDRDRIVYSRAFRRLRQKALSGILPAYEDHRRNRLTHTLEVTQLARTVGRALRLNEDLIEAIALGHDLGQPAFGPAGARALDDLLRGRLDGRGGPGLGNVGGFSCNAQALRVVDLLEKRYEHPGLNLSDSVREGIYKTGAPPEAPSEAPPGVRAGSAPAFEGQVVVLADRIAGTLHELDDALQSGAVELAEAERLSAVGRLREKLGRHYRPRAGRFMKANVIHRGLMHLLVTSAVVASGRSLARWARRWRVDSAARLLAVRDEAVGGKEIRLPPSAAAALEDLEGFLAARVRRGREADRVDGRGRRVLLGLFAAYRADPTLLEDHVLLRYKQLSGGRFLRDLPREQIGAEVESRYRSDARFARVIVDHLAAMTDTYALEEHARLMEMGAVPIPSVEQLLRESEASRRNAPGPPAPQPAEEPLE